MIGNCPLATVSIHEVGEDAGQPFMAAEYLIPDPQILRPVGPMALGWWKSRLQNVGSLVTQGIF